MKKVIHRNKRILKKCMEIIMYFQIKNYLKLVYKINSCGYNSYCKVIVCDNNFFNNNNNNGELK
jgi:hypothetical protein